MRNSKLLKITLTAAAALTFASFAESSAKADTQADIDAITQKIKDTEKSIKEGQEKLSKLEDLQYQKSMEIDGLKKNIKARKAQLARQARAAQVNNAGSMIDFVSKSKNLSEAARLRSQLLFMPTTRPLLSKKPIRKRLLPIRQSLTRPQPIRHKQTRISTMIWHN